MQTKEDITAKAHTLLKKLQLTSWVGNRINDTFPSVFVIKDNDLFSFLIVNSDTSIRAYHLHAINGLRKIGVKAFYVRSVEEINSILKYPSISLEDNMGLQVRLEAISNELNKSECETYPYCDYCDEKKKLMKTACVCANSYLRRAFSSLDKLNFKDEKLRNLDRFFSADEEEETYDEE